ncbi:DUF4041 domain-containing protein [Pseudescherichia sp.]|uniref:DUF4041 domain-containing protein n=1 Tax=Pseudescherichia sp. TaxID=2055881 RepID=UPI00289E61E0|nr:DUF4041 domain-containing protein [Pseudescherichia sp.]
MNTIYVSVAGIALLVIVAAIILISLKKLRAVRVSEASKSAQLEKYAVIVDAEHEAERLRGEAEHQAHEIVDKAKTTATLLERESNTLLSNAEREAKRLRDDAERQAQGVIDKAENIATLLEEEANVLLNNTKNHVLSLQDNIKELRFSYSEKKKIYDELEKAISIYREDVEFAEMGAYEPHFDFDTSEEFKEAIRINRDKQKSMLRVKSCDGAIWCGTEWTVHNSRAEGKKMTSRAINLTARAFNGECDAAVANCNFKNWSIMFDRMHAAFNKINTLNEVNNIHINPAYLKLKTEELDLVHSYKMKKQAEKEEQREIRAQMAEERKAQLEIERAIKEAEADEMRAQKALDKARKEMEAKMAKMTAEQAEAYQSKIDALQEALTEAELKGRKALSMAQQTKRGHVYVISNIGSFGENVFKIGMTRRLDPQDRVDELGSASVPFLFDVHAMIHSEDAPALESALHQYFDGQRTNLINRRKEFFNVSLKDIKKAVYKLAGNEVDFVETVVAQHYYETLALLKKKQEAAEQVTIAQAKEPRFAEAI